MRIDPLVQLTWESTQNKVPPSIYVTRVTRGLRTCSSGILGDYESHLHDSQRMEVVLMNVFQSVPKIVKCRLKTKRRQYTSLSKIHFFTICLLKIIYHLSAKMKVAWMSLKLIQIKFHIFLVFLPWKQTLGTTLYTVGHSRQESAQQNSPPDWKDMSIFGSIASNCFGVLGKIMIKILYY